GFYHKITEDELLEELRPNPYLNEKQLKYKAIKLVDTVKERKEVDNISLILAHVVRMACASDFMFRNEFRLRCLAQAASLSCLANLSRRITYILIAGFTYAYRTCIG